MHKLVTIGDSLTQGFTSGSVYRTDRSYPHMIASALRAESFSQPRFDNDEGKTGGFPFNIEVLLHKLALTYPDGIPFNSFPRMIMDTNSQLDAVEQFWEKDIYDQNRCHHNLAILSYTLQESYRLSSRLCREETASPRDNWLLFCQMPEKPMYRAAMHTLASSDRALTQLDRVKELAEDGGIENLIIFLGANNCLGAIIELSIKLSEESDLYKHPHKRRCNLWLPSHFRQCLDFMASSIRPLNIENVFIATVPHVTIPPISRGTPPQSKSGKYYDYYTRPWIWDSSFLPWLHPSLKRKDVALIDEFIDYYNNSIKTVAYSMGWHVVDFCETLNTIAFRRKKGDVSFTWPSEAVEALSRNALTSYLVKNGTPSVDTRYIRLDKNSTAQKRTICCGGLFSLDAVHPTTFMYGIIAEMFLKSMRDAGVKNCDGSSPSLDWDRIVSNDSLLTNPPLLLNDLRSIISRLSGKLHGQIFFKLLECFKSNF
ncbi:MAG: hypothetical protein ACLFQB_12360 [Chitinispirillaceae bacterium]